MVDSVLHDLRAGIRALRRRPGFAALTVATLAVTIGLSTSVFTAIHAVLLRPLPYANPDELVLITHQTAGGDAYGAVSSPDMLDYRDESRLLAGVAAVNSFGASLTGDDGDAEQIQLGVITANFFSVLGVQPRYGREFEAADDTPLDTRDPRNSSVIMLGHGLWQRRYGGDPGVVGRTIRVGGTPMVVVGILPSDFRLYMPSGVSMVADLDAWTPLRVPYATAPREGAYLKLIGRLRPNVTVAQAQAEADRIAGRLRARFAFHEAAQLRARILPMHDAAVAHVESVLAAVAAAVGFVLLIGCANIANLLLVRLATRDREILVRTALGATRARLVRQLLTESVVLALLGAGGGIGLGWAGVWLLRRLEPVALPHSASITMDPVALAFAVGLALASVLFFGLAPAFVASRPDLSAGLRMRNGTGGVSWRRFRGGLVVGEVALSVALLVAAGVMVRSSRALQAMDLGFEPRSVTTFRVSLPFTRYRRPDDWIRFTSDLERSLGVMPGVRSVGAASALPASGAGTLEPFALEASREDQAWGARSAVYRTVTPGYFTALSISLRSGRGLADGDRADRPAVVVVDEALARRLWPNESAVGQHLQISVSRFDRGYRVERITAEIVGVAATVATGRPDAAPPGTIYLAHAQQPLWSMAFTVAGDGRPLDVIGAVRGVLADVDAELPLYEARPMSDVVAETMASTRVVLSTLTVFASVAAALAAVGLYAVIAYVVRQRRRELAIRIALGATPKSVGVGVLRDGLALVAGGVVAGTVVSVMGAGLLADLVVGVPPRDPLTLVTVGAILLVVGALATFVPAYRAASVDPVIGLRED